MKRLIVFLVAILIDQNSANQCLGRKDGTFLPLTGSCTNYVSCYKQLPHEKKCPEPFLFNRLNQMCDWPEHVPDCKIVCEKDDGIVLQPSKDSCVDYIMCVNGQPTVSNCGEGNEFDEKSRTCVPVGEGKCSYNPCVGSANTFIPSHRCNEFYICNGEIMIQQKCPEGDGYSIAQETCVDLEESDCASKNARHVVPHAPIHVVPEPVPVAVSLKVKKICSKVSGTHFFVNPFDRSYYLMCHEGEAEFMKCPGNAFFDVESLNCMDKGEVLLGNNIIATVLEHLPNSIKNLPRPSLSHCSGLSGTHVFPNPYDCRFFFVCQEGKPFFAKCKAGQAFDLKHQACIDNDEAVCSSDLPDPSPEIDDFADMPQILPEFPIRPELPLPPQIQPLPALKKQSSARIPLPPFMPIEPYGRPPFPQRPSHPKPPQNLPEIEIEPHDKPFPGRPSPPIINLPEVILPPQNFPEIVQRNRPPFPQRPSPPVNYLPEMLPEVKPKNMPSLPEHPFLPPTNNLPEVHLPAIEPHMRPSFPQRPSRPNPPQNLPEIEIELHEKPFPGRPSPPIINLPEVVLPEVEIRKTRSLPAIHLPAEMPSVPKPERPIPDPIPRPEIPEIEPSEPKPPQTRPEIEIEAHNKPFPGRPSPPIWNLPELILPPQTRPEIKQPNKMLELPEHPFLPPTINLPEVHLPAIEPHNRPPFPQRPSQPNPPQTRPEIEIESHNKPFPGRPSPPIIILPEIILPPQNFPEIEIEAHNRPPFPVRPSPPLNNIPEIILPEIEPKNRVPLPQHPILPPTINMPEFPEIEHHNRPPFPSRSSFPELRPLPEINRIAAIHLPSIPFHKLPLPILPQPPQILPEEPEMLPPIPPMRPASRVFAQAKPPVKIPGLPVNPPAKPYPLPIPPEVACPKSRGVQYFPNPYDCRYYLKCENGEPFLEVCDAGLAFDIISTSCVPIETAVCPRGKLIDMPQLPPVRPNPRPIPDLPMHPVEIDCPETTGIHFIVNPYDCAFYVVCENGNGRFKKCPSGKGFDIETQTCIDKDEANCHSN